MASTRTAKNWPSLVRLVGLLRAHKGLAWRCLGLMSVSAAFALTIPYLFGQAVGGIQQLDAQRVVLYGALAITAGLLSAVVGVMSGFQTGELGLDLGSDVRGRIFRKVLDSDAVIFEERPTADLVSRSMVATIPITNFLKKQLPTLLKDVLIVVMSAVILFVINPLLAVLTLWPIPIVVYLTVRMCRRLDPVMVKAQVGQGLVTVKLQESMEGLAYVATPGAQAAQARSFRRAVGDWMAASVGAVSGISRIEPWISNLPKFGMVTLLIVGGTLTINGDVSLAVLATFLGYCTIMYNPLDHIGGDLWAIVTASASSARGWEIVDEEPVLSRPADPAEPDADSGVVVTGVTHSFDDRVNALTDIDLAIDFGENVTILGGVGSGTSTMLDLMRRLRDPAAGDIRIGGVSIRDMSAETLKSSLKYIHRRSPIFAGSIRHNICYGRPDATEDELTRAAYLVDAADWISELPDGYDTVLEPDLRPLDNDKAAQISIARAVITEPTVLLLDRATQDLSSATERTVARRLASGMPRTSVIAAGNRPGLLELGDDVVILDGGRVVESGAISELAESSPRLRRLLVASPGQSTTQDSRATPPDAGTRS